MVRPKILVADDDPECLRLSTLALRLRHYRVFEAQTGTEAIDAAARHRPQCIVLDYFLGDQTALDVSNAIRAKPGLRTTPIVVLTGNTDVKLRSYRACGADHVVVKNGDASELVAVVESTLRRLDWDRGVIAKGDLRLDPQNHTVTPLGGPSLKLSLEQFSLFCLLVAKSPEPATNSEIFSEVLHVRGKPEDTDAIRSLVCRTRDALGVPLRRRIQCIKGFGWLYLPERLESVARRTA